MARDAGRPDAATGERVTARSGSVAADPLLHAVVNGKYRVVDVIAVGGMGRIYRAEQTSLGRLVALKVLLPDLHPDPAATPAPGGVAARFFREASVLARLQHPNVVTVHDYGRIDSPAAERERFFMAMELLDGETLQERLDRAGPLGVPEAMEIVRQTALGLRAAHARGIVHRDLKPSNLMIVKVGDGEEVVKLLDFGVTKVLDENHDQDLTGSGVVIGSPRFMAPEQFVGGKVDPRTDIYSLGLIAYALLTGAPPFVGRTGVKTMWAHLNEPVPPLAGSRADVPEWFEEVIQRCAAKDPDARYQTVDAVLEALRSHLPSVAPPPPGDTRPSHPSRTTPLTAAVPWSVPPLSADAKTESAEPTDDELALFVKRPRAAVVVAIAAVLVAALGIGLSVTSSSPGAGSSPPASAVAPPAPAVTAYRLSIVSTPADAEVFEGGVSVGRTPLVTTIPAGAGVTHLEVRRDGYLPYAYDLVGAHDTEIVAVLTPERASPAPTPPRTWPLAPSARPRGGVLAPPPRVVPKPRGGARDPFDRI